MEHKELYELLETLKIPVAYNHFDTNKNINPPFIAYRETSPETFKAENKTYFRPYNFEIELVTELKNPQLEKSVEALLNNNNIPYDKYDEIWDEEERIYHNFYEI